MIHQWTYDDTGLLKTHTLNNRTITYTYDTFGQLKTQDGSRTDTNDIITYTYDAQGRITQITNGLGHTITYSDFSPYHLPQTLEDANGTITKLEYDLRGRLTKSTIQSEQGDAVYTYQYAPNSLLTQTTRPDGVTINFTYDDARRLIAIENTQGHRIEYTKDPMGNTTRQLYKNESAQLTYQLNQLFDELGRLRTLVQGNGELTQNEYDIQNRLTSTQDPRGNLWQNTYDALDRLITTLNPDNHTAEYQFDSRDNLTQVKDQRGVTTQYQHNDFDEVITTISPDSGTTTYLQDKTGNIIEQTDGRGIKTQRQYDALNRLTQITYPSDASKNATFTYDQTANNNIGIGRLTQINDPTGVCSYRYDDRGNLLSDTWTAATSIAPNASFQTQYEYDLADNLKGIIYPTGVKLAYTPS